MDTYRMTGKTQSDFEEFRAETEQGIQLFADKKIIATDDERLLRETFAINPKQGCSLLFCRYYESLCSHAIRFVHSKEIAEDIVSELFASFWQERSFDQVTSSYRAYLYKAVRHRAYNYLRWKVHLTEPLDSVSLTTASKIVNPDDAQYLVPRTLGFRFDRLKLAMIKRLAAVKFRRELRPHRVKGTLDPAPRAPSEPVPA